MASEAFNRLLAALEKVPVPTEPPTAATMRAGMEQVALQKLQQLGSARSW